MFQLPHWTQYRAETCTYFFSLLVEEEIQNTNGTWPQLPAPVKSSTLSFPVPLRVFRYFVGIYFPKQIITDTYNATVHLSITGNDCNFAGTFWDGNACVQAKGIPDLNSTVVATLTPLGINLFYVYIPELTAEITVEVPGLVRTC